MDNKPIDENRLAHMIGVAEYMYEHAKDYNVNKEQAYLVGLTHDIGYIYGNKEKHEEKGAKLISETFNFARPKDLYTGELKAIEIHNITPKKYFSTLEKFNTEEIEKFHFKNNMLILLWEADMSVDLTGENVGFDKRLRDIRDRHGEDSRTYKICKETIDYLKRRGKNNE